MYMPKPGDIGVSSSDSLMGKCVRVAQSIVGDWSIYTHSFIYIGNGKIVEAMPQGARIDEIDKYTSSYLTTYSKYNLTDGQRSDIVDHALSLVGKPYGWIDFLALGALHFNIRPHYFVEKVHSSDSYICSQLCAESYKRAGVPLFEDNRPPMEVTPGDLANLFAREDYNVTETNPETGELTAD